MVAVVDTIETNTQRDFNRHLEREFLAKLYSNWEVNQEFPASYLKVAEATKVPSNIVSRVAKILLDSGILERRFQHNTRPIPGVSGTGGRSAFWTLKSEYAVAAKVLEMHQRDAIKKADEGRKRGLDAAHEARREQGRLAREARANAKTAAKAQSNHQPIVEQKPKSNGVDLTTVAVDVEAIAGAKALVEQTRDYMQAANIIRLSLDGLKAAGVNVDEEAFMASINVPANDTFAIIAAVMPYIDMLEGKRNA